MKRKKRLTVTVGVPAYNEAENIANLLDSILRQKGRSFRLERIIVVSDGSTDATVDVVGSFKDKRVKVVAGRKRLGKAQRLNQLYRMNKSEIIVTLDGDVVLHGEGFMEKMVLAFRKAGTVVVAGNDQPMKAETLVERIYNAGYQMWYEIRKDYRGGDNVNNLHGGVVALKASFVRSIKYPKNTISDGGFLYMIVKSRVGEFRFVKSAKAFFRSVNNLGDFFLQASRNLNEKNMLVEHFGNQVYGEYWIPRRYKIRGIKKAVSFDPLFASLAIFLSLWLRFFPAKQDSLHERGMWKMARSTKKGIMTSLRSLL